MGTDRLIYFRTDGNGKIASGHLMRCVSIALACREMGMKVCFLVSDEESYGLLQNILQGCQLNACQMKNFIFIRQLKTAFYDNLEQEIPEVISLLSSCFSFVPHSANDSKIISNIHFSDDTFVTTDSNVINSCSLNTACHAVYHNTIYFLDSYYVTEKYLSSLKPYAKIVYLDDLQLFDYPVDLLVNYDVIPDGSLPSYEAACQNAGQLLLGAAYTPLRRQFLEKQITVNEQVTDILITTGGSDPYHFCLHLLWLILNADNATPWNQNELSNPTLHIVVGKLSKDKEQLRKLANQISFLQLHENVNDMASLMGKCDLAVSAAGTTLYELCALGIPTVSFTIADNQLTAATAFDKVGAIPCAGDLRKEPEKVYAEVIAFLTKMSDTDARYHDASNHCNTSLFLRKSAHEAMRRLVDGKGALRIADALRKL